MSYSCLNMDDLNDQLNLETVNLCLKTENIELETDQIQGINLLNNFLLSFDLFRGSFFQDTLTGYYIPFIQGNLLNYNLYDNLIGTLDFAPEMVNLYDFFQEQYVNTINYISVFSKLDTETYIITKELLYYIDTVYKPNILTLIDKDPSGPKGVFRKSTINAENTDIIVLDDVTDVSVGMYVRGSNELDNGGDDPITDPNFLPKVTAIDSVNSSVTVSIPTKTKKGGLFLFGFPEFISFNTQGTGEYPDDSQSYIYNMEVALTELNNYLIEYKFDDFETIVTDATVNVNNPTQKFYLETTDGSVKEAPEESMVLNLTNRIDQTDPSNQGRPFRFSTTPDGTWGGGVEYTDNVKVVGTPGFSSEAYVEITITEDTPDTLYYFCPNLADMGNKIVVIKN